MWRVCVGAVLSMTDLGTDLLVLYQFWKGGVDKEAYFDMSLASLVMSMVCQTVLVLFQNHKFGPGTIIKEILIALSGFKGAWDAFKVAMGQSKDINKQINPMLEMTASKSIEVFCESIPSMVRERSAERRKAKMKCLEFDPARITAQF